jgi:adenosylcobinamide kinase / adenosylcobinamide-phosphate guanylyltransferase
MRARMAGRRRQPGQVRVDDILLVNGTSLAAAGQHVVLRLPGGWDVTGPDGVRMLLAEGPGMVPEPLPGASPYDIALLDLLAEPAQLGLLRSVGLVRPQTAVVALCTDHRASSEQEMARRCELWGAAQGQDGQLIRATTHADPAPASAPPRPRRTLIIGGARSGKSAEAQLRLCGEPNVSYLAAGPWPDDAPADTLDIGAPDAEWSARVAAHRAARPSWWRTLETLDVAGVLREETGAVLVDGIGTWLAGVLASAGLWDETAGHDAIQVVRERIAELVHAWRHTRALVVAVTDQVGSGVVPAFPSGRVFRDQLGWLNQRLAAESELNLLVVAGRVVDLSA